MSFQIHYGDKIEVPENAPAMVISIEPKEGGGVEVKVDNEVVGTVVVLQESEVSKLFTDPSSKLQEDVEKFVDDHPELHTKSHTL